VDSRQRAGPARTRNARRCVHCTAAQSPDKASTREASRRLRIARHIDATPRYCEECAAWHVVSVDRRISAADRVVLFKIAADLRAHENARDIGESDSTVVNRTKALMHRFDALSRAYLCVLAVFDGLVDPRESSRARQARHPTR
jgi:hypothetical protein